MERRSFILGGLAIPAALLADREFGMTGFAHDIASGQGNLIVTALQSPNFLTGVRGWQIAKNGDAEFNDITIRGSEIIGGSFVGDDFVISQSGVVFYSSTPTTNNMESSQAPATFIDPYGNEVLEGSVTYYKSGATYWAIQTLANDVLFQSSNTGQTGWTVQGTYGQNQTAANDFTVFPASASSSASINGAGFLKLTNSAGIPCDFSNNANGTPQASGASALTGTLPLVQTNIGTHAVGNTLTAGDITASWPVPANDGVAGTSYVIKAFATVAIGPTTVETLTLGVDINGTQTALATLGVAFNGSALSAGYDIPLELALNVDVIGANLPEIVLSGPLGISSANRLATNSANMPGRTTTATFNKANANTIAIYAQWGGAGGAGQNIQTVYSKFYREGP